MMPNQKACSAAPASSSRSRSNSLQRMLDLEKRYQLDRMQATTASANTNTAAATGRPSPIATKNRKNVKYPPSPKRVSSHSPRLAAPASSDKQQTPWPQPLSRKPHNDKGMTDNNNGSQSPSSPQTRSPSQSQSLSLSQTWAQAPSQPGSRTRTASGPPQLQLDLHLPPLNIDYRAPVTAARRDKSVLAVAAAVASPEESVAHQDTASQPVPGDSHLRATCQSPTWEAYARDKKEKKERREEQREKEHMDKDSKAKRRLISKAPPQQHQSSAKSSQATPNVQHLNQKLAPSVSASTDSLRAGPHSQKPRPASVLGLPTPIPIRDDGPSGRRSRSGSFSSLVKSTFDLRRSSVDEPCDPGFIGGVKLDQQRRAAHQKALDGQVKATEADIHPALRSTPPDLSSPFHFDFAASQSTGGTAGASRRTYPPITRQVIPTNTRPPPTPASSTDHSMISKWRVRVGLKPSPKKSTPDGTKADVASYNTNTVMVNNGLLAALDKEMGASQSTLVTAPYNTASKGVKNQSQPASTSERRKTLANIGQPRNADDPTKRKSTSDMKAVEDARATDDPGSSTLSLPPAPPRRSSKRNSMLTLQALSSAATATSPSSAASTDSKAQIHGPLTNKKSDTAKSSVPKVAVEQWRESTSGPWASSSRRPRTSSSEDSYSEDLHSPSPFSTPDTSRPQSERGMTPIFADAEKRFALDDYSSYTEQPSKQTAKKSPLNATGTRASSIAGVPDPSAPFDDPIQAAARKVLAAFPDMPASAATSARPSIDRRSQSDPLLLHDASGLLPKSKHRQSKSKPVSNPVRALAGDDEPNSPPLRDLILGKNQSSVVAPWPATYLEAARKAAPAAAAPKGPFLAAKTTAQSGSTSRPRGLGIEPGSEPLAKMFVECCGCKYYHDMPSKLYAAMSNPGGVVSPGDKQGFEAAISMTVRCPWCNHEMSTKCCAGLAALVYVKERLH